MVKVTMEEVSMTFEGFKKQQLAVKEIIGPLAPIDRMAFERMTYGFVFLVPHQVRGCKLT